MPALGQVVRQRGSTTLSLELLWRLQQLLYFRCPAAPVGFDGAVLLVRCIRIPKVTNHNLVNDRFHGVSTVPGNTGCHPVFLRTAH